MISVKIIKIILFSLGLLILTGLVRRIGISEITRAISQADFRFALLGIFFYIILIFVRSLKWFVLIGITKNKVNYKGLLPICLVNSLMSNLTPFKSGETLTPLLLKKYLKVPVGQGLSVLVLDRFFELMTFTIFLVFAVFYVMNAGIENRFALTLLRQIFIVLIVFIAALIVIMVSRKITLKILSIFNFLKKYPFFKRVLEFIEKELDIFYGTLPLFKNRKIYQFIIPLTFLAWVLELVSYYFVFTSVISIPFVKVAVAQLITAAATFVTFLPGGLGIAEGGAVYVLKLFGYSTVLTLSAALLVRILLTGTLLISGLIGSLLLREKKQDYQALN